MSNELFVEEAYNGAKYYDKDAVDALLAKKDKTIVDLIKKNKRLANKDLIMASETIKDLFKEINHHKYKRCLAMAEICRHEWCTMYYERKNYSENKFLDYLMSKKDRHKNKWLELAEKFKEAK